MLHGRIYSHIKEQNWFSVILDFLIVVVGIFIAMQVSTYAKELEERKHLDEKLVIILEETQILLSEIKEPPKKLNEIISSVDKLLKLSRSCTESENINMLLSTLINRASLADGMKVDTYSLNLHYPHLSKGFLKELRDYNVDAASLIAHSRGNSNIWLDSHLLKSPYIGMEHDDEMSLKLTKSFEEVCGDPIFIKEISIPQMLASVELQLANELYETTFKFEQSLKSELERLGN